MAKDRHRDDNSNDDVEEEEEGAKPKSRPDSDSESDYSDSTRKRTRKKSSRSRSRSSRDEESDSGSASDSGSGSDSESDSEYSSSEEERRRRRKRRERRRRREEKERERSKRRRKDKEKRKRKRDGEKEEKGKKRKDKEKRSKKKKKEKEKEKGKIGAVTNLWGKYGIIRETDMWNKRPEFTAWLLEVKKINLESLPNWEEKQMFKEFMEDHNTATFPSKKYYNLDAYYKHKMEKEMKKGLKKVPQTERTVFDDEEQRRLEQLQVREKQKEQEVEALKRSMQSGLAQAMKEQAQLREEMAYQYKIGNFEAAAAIQRRLDPDLPM